MKDNRNAVVVSTDQNGFIGYLELGRSKGYETFYIVSSILSELLLHHVKDKVVPGIVAVTEQQIKFIAVSLLAHQHVISLNVEEPAPFFMECRIQSDELNLVVSYPG